MEASGAWMDYLAGVASVFSSTVLSRLLWDKEWR